MTETDHRRDAWVALTTAALVRRDRKAQWPTVDDLTGKKPAIRVQTPDEIKAMFAARRAAAT